MPDVRQAVENLVMQIDRQATILQPEAYDEFLDHLQSEVDSRIKARDALRTSDR